MRLPKTATGIENRMENARQSSRGPSMKDAARKITLRARKT
jgi:hypothetical protein